ncbi:hypothetical protein LJB42_003083 [Komagataella kurtzmanii]|nr:hypothetical protein LJB42_003083 [Komagataella kurtzmanii]
MSNSKSLGIVFQSSRARNNSGNFLADDDSDDADTLEALNGKLNRLRLASTQTINNTKLAEIEKSIKDIESKIDSLSLDLSNESTGLKKIDTKSTQSLVFSPLDSKFEGSSPTFAISGILQEMGNQNLDNKSIIENANALVSVFQMHPYLKTELSLAPFGSRIQALLLNPQSEVIVSAYRISRYILLDSGTLELFNNIRLDLFLIISLSKEAKNSMEKSEALKLIRAIAEIDKNIIFININIIKSLLAILDHEEDPFYPIVLETVCEFGLLFPKLMYEADSFKYIIKSLMSGTSDFSECCLLWLLEMIDTPRTRKIVLYDFDPSLLVAPFIEHRVRLAEGNHRVDLKLLNHTGYLVTTFLKVLPGIYIVGQEDCNLVQNLLDCLDHRAVDVCSVIINILSDVFRLEVYPYPSVSHKEDRQTSYGIASDITNHGLALLLRLFLDKGLLYKLDCLTEDATIFKTRKEIELFTAAKDLIVGLLVLGSNLLPENYALNEIYRSLVPLGYTDMNQLPAKYELLEVQFRPDRIGSKISLKDLKIPKTCNQSPLKAEDPLVLRQKLMDTNVLLEKDYTKWDWGLVSQLIEGPLQNPTRLEETIKSTKFLKRIMSFYRPLKYRFSKLKRLETNEKFLTIGCKLMEALIKSDEGLNYLRESDLLTQVSDCLAQETTLASSKTSNSIFSAIKIRTSMTYGYFSIIGVLSRTAKSVKLLSEVGLLRLYDIITDSSAEREDLTKLILKENDYHISHTMQQILTKIAISATEKFRLFCTKLIVELLHTQEEAQEFFIEVLINQMYDPQENIANLAIQEVDNYATSKAQIEKFVETQPEPSILFKMKADSLLRKVFSISKGYNYLHDLGFIDDSLKNWITKESLTFVGRVEEILKHDLFIDSYSSTKSKKILYTKVPFHLYGEMVRTEEGALKLKNSGVVRNCTDFVQKFRWEKIDECDPDLLTLLKSSLWSIGFICSHHLGFRLLQSSNIVEDIIKRAETCTQINVKGVCFYVLGLIARTKEGAEILDDEGWESVFDKVNGLPVGICLPTDLSKFFVTEEVEHYRKRSNTLIHEDLLSFWSGSSLQPENMIVISEICKNLINIILYPQKSINQLNKIKSRYSELFDTDPNLLLIVMALFAQYNYGLRARRFILQELFKAQELAGMCAKRSRKKLKEKEKLYRTPPPLS